MNFSEDIFKKGTIALLLFYLILYPILSFDYGVTGDEYVHSAQAKRVISYFTSGFQDKRSVTDGVVTKENGNIFYYGQSFDNFCELIHRVLPFTDLFNLRHAMGAIFGVIGMFFTALVVRSAGAGWIGAFIVMLMFGFGVPRYTGHMINNLKDAPFAVAYIINIYAMIRFFKEMPSPSKKSMILLALSLALPLSIRAGGLLSFGYLGLFAAVDILMKSGLKSIGKPIFLENIKQYSKYLIPIVISGYFIGLVLWPYGIENPLSAPFTALSKFSNFSTTIGQIFEGKMITSSELPWYYLLKFIGITMPIVTLLGLVLFFPMAWINRDKWNKFVISILLFTIVFPIAYIIYKDANVYGGWRHVLFVAPSLMALSALGWHGLFTSFKSNTIKGVSLVVFLALSILPLKYLIAYHPYGVVYFNEFVGGTEGAYGNYEMDYYGTSLKSCERWLAENENLFNRKDKIHITTNAGRNYRYLSGFKGHPSKLPESVDFDYSRYNQRSEKPWDLAIWQNIYIPPSQLTNGTYPNNEVLYKAGVGKAVFAAIVKRPSKEDYNGFQALNSGNTEQAIEHFKKYIEVDKSNETVYQALARAFFDTGDYKNAANAAGNALKLDRSLLQVYNIAGLSYLNLKDYNNAISAFGGLIKVMPNPSAYYYLAICYANLNDRNTALAYVNNALQMNPNFKEALQLKQQLSGGK